MPRMKHENHGVHHFGIHEIEQAQKDGWKPYTDEDHAAAIAAKLKSVIIESNVQATASTEPAESAPAPAARRGRPPKV